MKVKICGITNLEDALFAVENGATAIGFNFYPESPRYIDRKKALSIMAQLPEKVVKVGIFVEESLGLIIEDFNHLGLDLVQVYKDGKFSAALKRKMILSLHSGHEDQLPAHRILKQYGFILLDAPKLEDGLLGGTGRLANWNLAKKLSKKYRLILGGGLKPENISKAILATQPFGVDVASGVEHSPGKKDCIKLKQFLEECKSGQ